MYYLENVNLSFCFMLPQITFIMIWPSHSLNALRKEGHLGQRGLQMHKRGNDLEEGPTRQKGQVIPSPEREGRVEESVWFHKGPACLSL